MLRLVVDTNLFHEFRSLESLPWEDLGEADRIELIVTDVVQTELDEHKKSNRARLKRTAIKVTKQFREMLLANQNEFEVRPSGPRVTLHLCAMSFGTETYGILDLSNLDDQLVAIAKRVADKDVEGVVKLFSNDTRPLRKAVGVNLGILAIPDEWRRTDEQTEDDKERSRLSEENRRLRSQEPILGITSNLSEVHEMVLQRYAPLTEDEINHFMAMLLDANPQETNFERGKSKNPRSLSLGRLTSGISQYEFAEAKQKDIDNYNNVAYPQWETTCRDLLESAHDSFRLVSRCFEVAFSLNNTGTRPAEDVLFRVGTQGALAVMPPVYQDDEDETEDEPVVLRFPRVPSAPQGKWEQLHTSKYGMASFLDPFGQSRSTFVDRIPSLLQPKQRDPNSFFYKDRPDTYVQTFELTCTQFRHAGGCEVFDCMCFVDGTAESLDGKSAVIEVSAEAANLSDPVRLKVPVKFSTETKSTFEAVAKIVSRSKIGFDASNS